MDENPAPTPEETTAAEAESVEDAAQEPAADALPDDFPIPPANFEFLVLSLRSQAEMHLGLLHYGEEKDRPKPNVRLARHAIDLLVMVQEKTRGNLSLEESRLLENSVTELRFRCVQAAEGGQ